MRQGVLPETHVDVAHVEVVIAEHGAADGADEYRSVLQAEIVELQNTYMKYQKLVAKKELALTEPILEKLEEVLEKIGKSQGYLMILRKEAVAWIPDAKDVTDHVIKIYNKEPAIEFKTKKKKSK